MDAVETLVPEVGIDSACSVFGISRAGLYRRRTRKTIEHSASKKRPSPPRTLSNEERQTVLDVLHSDRFQDKAPYEVYATLLDEGIYYCSIRTMYRILEENEEVKERRDQLRHPKYEAPELLAVAPNEVWSWDITKLRGPAKWTYFYLYVIIDIFSRYVVGWMVASCESSTLAKRLIQDSYEKQLIQK